MFLAAVGAVELVLLATLAWWPGTGMPLPGLLLYAGAFLAYVLAARIRSADPGAGSTVVIWSVAVLLRLALLPAAPELSDDVFRYLWDGHVQLEGVNPYRYAPSDAALSELRTPWHDRINNPQIPTVYPPVAQGAFLAVALLGGGILQAKLLWVGLDLLAGWVLARVARATGRDGGLTLLLYLWCPLLVVETAWSAHLEPLGLLAMALLLWCRRMPVKAGVAGAAAALTKFAPAAALPPLLRRHGARFAAGFVLATGLLLLPYAAAGPEMWEGLFTYVRDWRFMAGPFALVEAIVPGRWASRAVAGAAVGGIVVWSTVRGFDAERALFWILGAGLLLSPTVHPWYLLWMLPFAALRRSGPWILLCGLVFLGYWGLDTFQETGVWPQPAWLRLLVWGPPLAWLTVRQIRGAVGPDGGGSEPGAAQGQIPSSE